MKKDFVKHYSYICLIRKNRRMDWSVPSHPYCIHFSSTYYMEGPFLLSILLSCAGNGEVFDIEIQVNPVQSSVRQYYKRI